MKRRQSNYDKFPSIRVPVGPESVWQGWREIVARIAGEVSRGAQTISVEIYPGVFEKQVLEAFVEGLHPAHVFRTGDCWKTRQEIDAMVSGDLTDDPVFGRISRLTIEDFADPREQPQSFNRPADRRRASPSFLVRGPHFWLLNPMS